MLSPTLTVLERPTAFCCKLSTAACVRSDLMTTHVLVLHLGPHCNFVHHVGLLLRHCCVCESA